MKTMLTSISLIMLFASNALAVDTSVTYNSGVLVLLFIGFCAAIIVVQLIPAILMLIGATKVINHKTVKVK